MGNEVMVFSGITLYEASQLGKAGRRALQTALRSSWVVSLGFSKKICNFICLCWGLLWLYPSDFALVNLTSV